MPRVGEVGGGPAGGPVGVEARGLVLQLQGRGRVLPGVEEEAVEGAGGGEQKGDGQEVEAELGKTGDGGDEDGGGKEDADGEFFGQAMCAVAGKGRAWMRRNQAPRSDTASRA